MRDVAALYSISRLPGIWTVPRLKAHFHESAIRRAIGQRILVESSPGSLSASRQKGSLLENQLTPGEEVLRIVDGKPVKMIVVKDDSGRVHLANPDQPKENVEASREDVLDQKDIDDLSKLGADRSGNLKKPFSTPL